MSEIKLNTTGGSGGSVSLKGPASTTGNADVDFVLPQADGSAGQYLKTDGSKNLSFATVSSVGGANAVSFNDNVKINIGTGTDSSIYHDTNNTIIQHNSGAAGDLFLRNRSVAGNGNIYIEAGNGTDNQSENAIVCMGTGQRRTKFYHQGNEVFSSSANGLAFPSGKGIDFSSDANNAGMDTELLDDYEEGYFTFTMDSENGDAWTSRAGYTKMRYIKIGNQVTFSGKYETNSSSGTPSGRLQITGLPFTSIAATSDANNTRAFHGYVRGMSADDRMIMHLWWMGSNSTTLLLHSFSNDYNGDMQSFAVAQLNTSTVWEGDVTGTYFTS